MNKIVKKVDQKPSLLYRAARLISAIGRMRPLSGSSSVGSNMIAQGVMSKMPWTQSFSTSISLKEMLLSKFGRSLNASS